MIERVRAELEAGGPLETVLSERRGHARELARAVEPGIAALFVLGGDGTYNEVVGGLVADVPVGFIPGGATSVLSRALGLPRDPVRCARALVSAAVSRRIGLGRVNGRRFAFACGLGLDAELVRAVDRRGRERGRRAGDSAFVWELTRILVRERGRLEPALSIDGVGRCAFAIVANCNPYTYAGPLPIRVAPRARFEAGLDLVAPRVVRRRDIGRLAWDVAVGAAAGSGTVARLHDVDRLHVFCDRPIALQVDGEDLGDVEEAEIVAERDVLTVLVQAPRDARSRE